MRPVHCLELKTASDKYLWWSCDWDFTVICFYFYLVATYEHEYSLVLKPRDDGL